VPKPAVRGRMRAHALLRIRAGDRPACQRLICASLLGLSLGGRRC
jgi:hypothetical protein